MTACKLCACGDELVTQKEVEGGMCETCRMLIDNDLSELLIAAMKELGEIAECLIVNNRSVEDTIKNYRPNHWKNELGDLCGLAVAPMLELAGLDFEAACEIGQTRKKEKMEGNAKKSVSEMLEKMGVEHRELKFDDVVVGWVVLTKTEPPDWIDAVFTIGEVIS